MGAVVGLSVYNPAIAAGVARISIATVAGIGFLLILSLAARGSDRAVMLIPTWYLLSSGWRPRGVGARLPDQRSGGAGADRRPGADRHADRLHGDAIRLFRLHWSDGSALNAQRRTLAMTRSGGGGLHRNVLHRRSERQRGDRKPARAQAWRARGASGWLARRVASLSIATVTPSRWTGSCINAQGRINHDLRLRGSDGHYFWYVLKARPVISADGEVVRVIGSLVGRDRTQIAPKSACSMTQFTTI